MTVPSYPGIPVTTVGMFVCICPNIRSTWLRVDNAELYLDIVVPGTGGIRCERFSALMTQLK